MNSPVQSPLPDPMERTLVDAVAEAALWFYEQEFSEDHSTYVSARASLHSASHMLAAHRAAHAPKAELDPLRLRLELACTAACNCETKTHEIEHHAPICRFRVLREAIAEIEARPTAATYEAAVKGRQDFRAAYRSERDRVRQLKIDLIARPSPDIDPIADAGKEVEFDEEATIDKFTELCGRKQATAEDDAVELVRWALRTFKPLPPQVQVEATEWAIAHFCRALGLTDGPIVRKAVRAALTHFRSPSRAVSDEDIVVLAMSALADPVDYHHGVIPRGFSFSRTQLIKFARALMDGKSA